MSAAESLYHLFAGSDFSHGTYSQEDQSVDGSPKVEIKRTARTLREPASIDHWRMHLSGTRPLGIVPIGPGDCCSWAAIDIDAYNGMDHGELVKKLKDVNVPAVVCRSKSGGAHVYLFFSDPLPAVLVISKTKQLAVLIGHSGSEIFPKQETVDKNKEVFGNWINMPYFGGDTGKRYAVRENGTGYTVDEFVALALKCRMTGKQFGDLKLRHQVDEFSSGPPCLETLVSNGITSMRNETLFAMGTLAKKMQPNDWRQLVWDWNDKYVKLGADEVTGVIKSLSKKDYNYKCSKEPIKSVCNAQLCATRDFGVSDGSQDVSMIETIMVYETDPPTFIVGLTISSKHVTVKVSGERLKNPELFQTTVLNTHHLLIPSFRHTPWEKRIGKLLEEAQHMEAPKEAGEKGQFFEILTNFLTDSYMGETREDLLQGKPWKSDDGYYYFRLQDLHTALDRNKFAPNGGKVRTWMANELMDLGASYRTMRIRERAAPISVYKIAANQFSPATPLGIPNVDESPL